MDNKQQEQLENLREIRTLMERSSRFLSLSGLSGVIAGIAAIAGVIVGYRHFGLSFTDSPYGNGASISSYLIADATLVLVVALVAATLLSKRSAQQHGERTWDATAKRLMINMLIPLVAGGIFCLTLIYHGHLPMVAPATLIFYGLAMLNASKYTVDDIRYLGIFEIITGLVAAVFVDYGLLLWAFGFGVLHIIYGLVLYFKYEK